MPITKDQKAFEIFPLRKGENNNLEIHSFQNWLIKGSSLISKGSPGFQNNEQFNRERFHLCVCCPWSTCWAPMGVTTRTPRHIYFSVLYHLKTPHLLPMSPNPLPPFSFTVCGNVCIRASCGFIYIYICVCVYVCIHIFLQSLLPFKWEMCSDFFLQWILCDPYKKKK